MVHMTEITSNTLKPMCLLIHGINGSPYDFEYVKNYLTRNGYHTETLLLPGHMVNFKESEKFQWEHWRQSVQENVAERIKQYASVVIIGHSMGAALAITAAAQNQKIAGLVSICAPARLWSFLEPAVRGSLVFTRFIPLLREDISDPRERKLYRQKSPIRFAPLKPMHSLLLALPEVRASLAQVQCPIFVIGAKKDHVVPAADAQYIMEHAASAQKKFLLLEKSWHIAMRDVEHEMLIEHIHAFLQTLKLG